MLQLKKITNEDELIAERFYLIKVRVRIGTSYYETAKCRKGNRVIKLTTQGYYSDNYSFGELEEVYEMVKE